MQKSFHIFQPKNKNKILTKSRFDAIVADFDAITGRPLPVKYENGRFFVFGNADQVNSLAKRYKNNPCTLAYEIPEVCGLYAFSLSLFGTGGSHERLGDSLNALPASANAPAPGCPWMPLAGEFGR